MPHAKDGTCFTHRVDKTQLFVVFVSRLLVCDDHLFLIFLAVALSISEQHASASGKLGLDLW
jgi:hypothetical protein